MQASYSYQETLSASESIHWRVEDIIGGDKQLDFTRPFMPESLARISELSFLSNEEKLVLNQIRGNTYLCIFGLVEEFILPFVLDHARPYLGGDDYKVRAFLQFASEEAKHIHLFNRFRQEFEAGFGTTCAVIGPPKAIAKEILAHHPLAVALAILQIEWMSQRHFLDSIRDNQELDLQFKSLLKHHWMEEAQHAKLDTLMVETIAAGCTAEEIANAVEEFLEIGLFLDGGLKQQTEFDMQALMAATGRTLTEAEQRQFMEVQHQANRWTYLGTGMTHPKFLGTLGQISPAARQRVEGISLAFC